MRIVYDGPSLPMLQVGSAIFRIQMMDGTGWRTLENEQEYIILLDAIQKEVFWDRPGKLGDNTK